ncbi:cullin-4A [Trichonephila clavipes]|uniref:Cullin-4A n=1 Tax=Trichonephila clavipes TaxID=2585209 RepID=A0A8X7BI87_TRICX|nr:cullin-4A [Trichonephila clavipes]
MNVCNCIVPSRHGGTLNSRRAASPLVRLAEKEEMLDAPDHSQNVFHQTCGGTELNCTVTCMLFKAKAKDRRKNLALAAMNFVGLGLITFDQVA